MKAGDLRDAAHTVNKATKHRFINKMKSMQTAKHRSLPYSRGMGITTLRANLSVCCCKSAASEVIGKKRKLENKLHPEIDSLLAAAPMSSLLPMLDR
jgi:hypothetical protein